MKLLLALSLLLSSAGLFAETDEGDVPMNSQIVAEDPSTVSLDEDLQAAELSNDLALPLEDDMSLE
jgi:hypothetical protein